jgi:hypothetical protein
MARRRKLIEKIDSLSLSAEEIVKIIDATSITDEVVDFISKKYKHQIENDSAFQHIKDVIDLVDLTKFDEQTILESFTKAARRSFFSVIAKSAANSKTADEEEITSAISDAAKRSFLELTILGKISRPEIIYFIKVGFASDDDIKRIFDRRVASQDLVDVVLRWRPQLFQSTLSAYCNKFGITNDKINDAKRMTMQLGKFDFIMNPDRTRDANDMSLA